MELGMEYPIDICEDGMMNSSAASWNSTNGTLIDSFYYLPWEWIPAYTIKPIILVIGILCNFTFLLVCIRVPYMQTVSNIFLINLALVDILYLVVSVGYSFDSFTTNIRQDTGSFGVTGCFITYFAFWFCYFATMLLLTLASFEQFMAVCYQGVHDVLLNARRKATVFTVIVSGVAAATAAVFLLLFSPHQIHCIFAADHGHQNIVNGINGTTSTTLPMPMLRKMDLCHLDNAHLDEVIRIVRPSFWAGATLACLFMYIVIYIIFVRRDKAVEENTNSDVDNYRNPVVFMLFISSIVTLVMWALPIAHDIISILAAYDCMRPLSKEGSITMATVVSCLTLLTSALKPIVYSATHWRYREAYGQVFEMFSFGGKFKRSSSMRGGLSSVRK